MEDNETKAVGAVDAFDADNLISLIVKTSTTCSPMRNRLRRPPAQLFTRNGEAELSVTSCERWYQFDLSFESKKVFNLFVVGVPKEISEKAFSKAMWQQ